MCAPILNFVVLRFAKLDSAAAFYAALGCSLKKEQHGSGPEHYSIDAGFVVIELYPGGKIGAVPGTGMLGLGIASIESALAAATAHGGSLVSPVVESERGLRAVVLDPGGHRIELLQRVS